MRVFGIDPGSYVTGYGIVEKQGKNIVHIDNGVIRPKTTQSFACRLFHIYEDILKLINKYSPQAVALEDIFVAKNVKASIKLGHIRGAAMLAAKTCNLDLAEYHPMQVKQAVVGTGAASKDQVQKMVRALLRLPEVAAEDASDALAVALCHVHSADLKRMINSKLNI